MKFPKLEVLVFVVGFAVILVEICGARLLQPYLGNTLFTWTSSISVILAALGIGYYLGGKVASHRPDGRILSVFVFTGAIFVAIIPFLSAYVLQISLNFGLEYGPLFASVVLFGIPNVFLGVVAPYAVRLKTSAVKSVGKNAGNLYAISTFGGILGALLSGYLLIPYLGINESFFAASFMLAAAGIMMAGLKGIPVLAVILAVALLPVASPYAGLNVVYEAETPYYNLAVVSSQNSLLLLTDLLSIQSVQNNANLGLYYAYQDLLYNKTSNVTALYLGLGGGEMVTDLYRNSNANISVVEIDPVVIKVAEEYFGLNDSGRIKIYNMDARSFLRTANSTYSMMVLDTYGSGLTMPPQMVTLEAAEEMKARLRANGAVLININSQLNGTGSCVFRSIYKTFDSVFPHVYIFPLYPNDSAQLQNIVLIASESNYSESYIVKQLNGSISANELDWIIDNGYNRNFSTENCSILTDNENPFEVYTAQALYNYRP